MINVPETITLIKHVTDGGAVYLTDNHLFAKASIVIRVDGTPEVHFREVTNETNQL